MTELQFPLPELTEKQREKVREFYAANPKGGYKSALAHAGLHVTKPVAAAMINGDEDLADLPNLMLRVDRQTALAAVGDIISDPEHKDRLRAALAALAMLHGVSEKQSLELTGADGGAVEVTNPDVAAAIERFTTNITRLTERAQPGGAVRTLAASAAEPPTDEAGD